jgi:hypothetical protein
MSYHGYGYSIWLIPENWKQFRKEFTLDFIPHITVATNLSFVSSQILNKDKFFKVNNFSNGQIFPKMYKNDPLNGFGYNCTIEGLYTQHQPHLTLYYSPNEIKYLDTFSKLKSPPTQLICRLFIADTRSINPSEWKVIY